MYLSDAVTVHISVMFIGTRNPVTITLTDLSTGGVVSLRLIKKPAGIQRVSFQYLEKKMYRVRLCDECTHSILSEWEIDISRIMKYR
ncbi:MAG: hypothetical protein ACTHLE_08095 [Agriterribacter sp.]